MLIALLLLLSQPTVDEIVSRHIAARGGHERIKAIRTLVFSGGEAFMALMRRSVGSEDQQRHDCEIIERVFGTPVVRVWKVHALILLALVFDACYAPAWHRH